MTDITVELIEHKNGRRVERLQFRVEQNKQPQLGFPSPPIVDMVLMAQVMKFGFTQSDASDFLAQHGQEKVKACAAFVEARLAQKNSAQLDSPAAYFRWSLKEGNVVAQGLQQQPVQTSPHGFGTLAVSRFETLEKDHGRIETRRHVWVDKLDWMEPALRGDWKNLAGVGMVERQREIKGKVSVERTFYIGSQGIASAQALAEAARGHWGVENRLHWVLDVTFHEDECRVRTGHAPRNFSTIRKFALTLLRQDQQYPKRSLRSRRKTADRLTDYRESLLGLQARG